MSAVLRNSSAQSRFRAQSAALKKETKEVAHKAGLSLYAEAEKHTPGPKFCARDRRKCNATSNLRMVSRTCNRGVGSAHVSADAKVRQAMNDHKTYYVTQREAAHIRDAVRTTGFTGVDKTLNAAYSLARDYQGRRVIDHRRSEFKNK